MKEGSFSKNPLRMLLRDFYSQHPGRFAQVMLGLLLAGFAGGIGLATFLPVLEVVTQADASKQSRLAMLTVDALSTIGIEPTLGYLLLVIIATLVVKGILLLVTMLQAGYVSMRITNDLRMELIRAVLSARWDFFIEKPLGAFANAVNSEAVRSSQAFFAAFLFVSDFFQIVVYVGLALVVSWKITLVAVLVSPLLLQAFRSFLGMARSSGREQTVAEKAVLSRVTDTLQGVKPIKAMGIQHRLVPIIEQDMNALFEALKRQILSSQVLKTMQEPLIGIVVCLAIYLLITYGKIETSMMLGLALLFYRSLTQLGSLQKRYQLVEIHQSAYCSLRGLINEAKAAAEKTNAPDESPQKYCSGPIEFCGVELSYGHKEIFSGLNLQFPIRGLVCIIGTSGAGKTSLVDMIAGLYTPTSGEIKIDGQPLANLDLQVWRTHIGYVPQEMILFNDTLKNNLTLGNKDYSDDDIWDALARAGLRDVVEALPEALESQLGERGVKLSGGQRQRLAVARAVIRKPEILILDEVTASLDPDTEQALALTLEALADEVLILAITHQSGLLRFADSVVRVSNTRAEMLPADEHKLMTV